MVGPSGCGKSTLLRVMALLLPPDSGSIEFEGNLVDCKDVGTIQRLRHRISFSFQEPLLLPYMTTLQNLVDVLSFAHNSHDPYLEERSVETLSGLGLSERLQYMPPHLSVGEKKRADIARALVRQCDLLLADEPFSNLDPHSKELVQLQLKESAARGGSVVYTSVDPVDGIYADVVHSLGEKGI